MSAILQFFKKINNEDLKFSAADIFSLKPLPEESYELMLKDDTIKWIKTTEGIICLPNKLATIIMMYRDMELNQITLTKPKKLYKKFATKVRDRYTNILIYYQSDFSKFMVKHPELEDKIADDFMLNLY